MKRTSLAAIGAVLAVIALSGCSDDPNGGGTPSPSATASPPASESPAATEGPAASESPAGSPSPPARETIPADEVTEAQKKACLYAIVEQIRAKKGGDMPEECVMLPDDMVGQLVGQALSGG